MRGSSTHGCGVPEYPGSTTESGAETGNVGLPALGTTNTAMVKGNAISELERKVKA